jgi:hypothetical protein
VLDRKIRERKTSQEPKRMAKRNLIAGLRVGIHYFAPGEVRRCDSEEVLPEISLVCFLFVEISIPSGWSAGGVALKARVTQSMVRITAKNCHRLINLGWDSGRKEKARHVVKLLLVSLPGSSLL